VIDYMKIDIEYSEWNSFEAVLKDGNILPYIKQLVFEIHTNELPGLRGIKSSVADFRRYHGILRGIEEAGFKRWRHHYNPWGKYLSRRTGMQRTCCYELFYINSRFSG
jgi:hypothetical protein